MFPRLALQRISMVLQKYNEYGTGTHTEQFLYYKTTLKKECDAMQKSGDTIFCSLRQNL
jgi:hypothetical protein